LHHSQVAVFGERGKGWYRSLQGWWVKQKQCLILWGEWKRAAEWQPSAQQDACLSSWSGLSGLKIKQ